MIQANLRFEVVCMHGMKQVCDGLQQRGYTVFVVTEPGKDLWKESVGRAIGLHAQPNLGEAAISWVKANASAWSLKQVEALAPGSGVTGYAVESDGLPALTQALRGVLEAASIEAGNGGMVGRVYREIGKAPRKAQSRPDPKPSQTQGSGGKTATSKPQKKVLGEEEQMKQWFGEV